MCDQRISESDIQRVAAKENLVDMSNLNMQLHGDLVSLMEECTEGFDLVRNTLTEVGLDAWTRLFTCMILVTCCETYSCWKSCPHSRKLALLT